MSVAEFLSMSEQCECYLCFQNAGFEIYIENSKEIESESLQELLDKLWVVSFSAISESVINIYVDKDVKFDVY